LDRLTNYFGQIPLETDLLHTNQNAMVGLAKLCAGVLGTSTVVNGFTCTPTTPASLNILVTPGEIYSLANLEATAWSSLPADTAHSIVKQGILLDAATLGISPPTTVGYSQVFLVEVEYQDVDSGSTVLPYYNAANPSSPFSGPGNSGSIQNTVRKGGVAVQIKAGVAAATGTQVAPTADAGWTGLFLVTVANGQTTITSGNITQLPAAPYIGVTLPGVPFGVQSGKWVWAGTFGGTANALTATLSPVLTSLPAGTTIWGIAAFTNTTAVTLAVNGQSAVSAVRRDNSAMAPGDIIANELIGFMSDGTHLRLQGIGYTEFRRNITAALTVYVRSDGNDSNNGLTNTAAGAFLTLQGAYNYVAKYYASSGFQITIQIGLPGTYVGLYAPNLGLNGNIVVQGDINNQSLYVITPFTGGDGRQWCFYSGILTLSISGMTCDMSSASNVNAGGHVAAGTNGALAYGNVVLKYTGNSATLTAIRSETGGTTYRTGPVTVNGGGTLGSIIATYLNSVDGGNAGGAATFTIGPINFTQFYNIQGGAATLASTTFASGGAVTGAQFNVVDNGVIDTAGNAVSVIPGNTTGSATGGGQVVGYLGNAWTTYTPTVVSGTGTITTASATGRYQRNGRTVNVQMVVTITTNGTGASWLNVGLPFNAAVSSFIGGIETALTGKSVQASSGAGNTVSARFYDGTYPGASGAVILLEGAYETSQ